MTGDIDLAGFVLTQAEWAALNPRQRALLLRVAGQRDGWVAAAPPPPRADEDAYEAYELAPAPSR